MDAETVTGDRCDVLVGYDGSPSATGAIEYGARLLPDAVVRIVHLWAPPFADVDLRRRVWRKASSLDELQSLLEKRERPRPSGSRGRASPSRPRRDGRRSR